MKNFLFRRNDKKVKVYRASRLRLISIIVITVVAAGIGVYTLRGSSAQTTVGYYTIDVVTYQDAATGSNLLGGVTVTLGTSINEGYICSTSSGTTSTTPGASFGHVTLRCPAKPAGTAYRLVSVSKTDMIASPSVPIGGSVTFYGMSDPQNALYLILNKADTDHDGVYDAEDNCDNQAGPASNKGCPVPAAKTTTPTTTTTPTKAKPKTPATSTKTPATTVDTTPPTKPSGLLAVLEYDSSVSLSWAAATDNVGITSYTLERSTDNTSWTTLAKDITLTSYQDDSLSPDTEAYYYRVLAKDAIGNQSEPSEVADVANTAQVDEQQAATEEKPDAVPLKAKKSNTGKVLGGLGIIMVVSGIAFGIWWYRRQNSQLGYASYTQPLPPNPPITIAPTPLDPAAPHTSKSLKDMVLEDLEHNKPHEK